MRASRLHIQKAESSLVALAPTKILERGYSITRMKHGGTATSASEINPGDEITVTFMDGDIDAQAK